MTPSIPSDMSVYVINGKTLETVEMSLDEAARLLNISTEEAQWAIQEFGRIDDDYYYTVVPV